ncbi:ABC transporter permease [Natranaerobius trueperi]|uniref:ABC transporter permease n=1 Tax=Natranaerobius trueperi TaxID=759412 RepID=A0A226BXR4_9FIRM|nr:ABC transporter permease [Natranaerobius trueperi]OWZ82897.1 ABC transporter permease [Natranaerobius trueperi]
MSIRKIQTNFNVNVPTLDLKPLLRRLLFFTILILLWEMVYRVNLVYEFRTITFFPSPLGVIEQLYNGFFGSKILLYATLTSFQRIIVGFIVSVLFGSILGILTGKWKLIDETLGSLITVLQTIPSIVWLPIALMMFQTSNIAIIFVVALGGTWAMALNTRMGIRNVDPLLIKAARVMGYEGFELISKVMLKASVPYLITGTRLAWAFGWRALMAAELLGTGGLGRTLMDAQDFFNFDLVIAIMVIISTTGLIVEHLIFKTLEEKVMTRWGLEI